MDRSIIGLSATRTAEPLYPFIINSNSLLEGAVVIHDSTAEGKVKAPGGAGATLVAGVLVDVTPSTGTVAGEDCNVQRTGICNVLLKATEAVTNGDKLQVAGTDGTVKALGTTDSCDIVGVALETRTAGAANELIKCMLQIQFTGDTVP